jgi:hypothetical protein
MRFCVIRRESRLGFITESQGRLHAQTLELISEMDTEALT